MTPESYAERLMNFWCGCDPRSGDECPEASHLRRRVSAPDLLRQHVRVAEVCLGLREIESFQDIPQLPPNRYEVDVEWTSLEHTLEGYREGGGLDLCPRFQRGHVWTEAQQVAYVESMLQGFEISRNILFNHPTWNSIEGSIEKPMVIVDGLQRLEAVRRFLRDDLRVFGRKRSEFSGRLRMSDARFKIRILSLPTEAAVIRLYLAMNAGGTPHSPDEIERVRRLLNG